MHSPSPSRALLRITAVALLAALTACSSSGALGPVAGITRPGAFGCSQNAGPNTLLETLPETLDVTISPEPGTANLFLTASTFRTERLLPDGPRRFASPEHAWAATGDDTALTDRRLARSFICREKGHVGAFGSWWPDPVRS